MYRFAAIILPADFGWFGFGAENFRHFFNAQNLDECLHIVPVAVIKSRFYDRLRVKLVVIFYPPNQIFSFFYKIVNGHKNNSKLKNQNVK